MSTETTTESRPQVGANVEVFDKTEISRFSSPLLHLAISRTIGPIGQETVYDRGEYDVNEHMHADIPRTRYQRVRYGVPH